MRRPLVVIFDEPTPRETIAALLPDVLVKAETGERTRLSVAKRLKPPAPYSFGSGSVRHSTTAILEKTGSWMCPAERNASKFQ